MLLHRGGGRAGAVTQHAISEGERIGAGQATTLGPSLVEDKATLAQARKVTTLRRALETYVAGQADLIIDYAAARHRGEPISKATTECTVQRLLHRRMGAHRMRTVRTAAERFARRPFRRAA